jgi:hypothetical protein
MMTRKKDPRTAVQSRVNTMHRTRQGSLGRLCRWTLMAGAAGAAMTFLATSAIAGPKGTITVRPLGNLKLTIDGDISDWPLDKFTTVAEQPLFPEGLTRDKTSALGDHIVFDPKRVGLFNNTPPDAFPDFGSSMYFAYDPKFLYILAVVIKGTPVRDDLDTSQYGSTGYLNDGFEFFLDPKSDSTGCVANEAAVDFDTQAPYTDDMQVTVALNKTFKPANSPDNVLGARQSVERAGNLDLIGPDKGGPGGIWRDALDRAGGPDIAARKYDDLRAAGARNPEILAKPDAKFAGYVIEMRVPFDAKIPGFAPDHNIGFELFWREVDGDGAISWATWAQSTTVTCNGATGDELNSALFNASNWGALAFDKSNFLGPAPQ